MTHGFTLASSFNGQLPTGRRLMHMRSVECNGYLRDDGLWEVEARLVDTKPFTQDADRYREALKPGDPVHDIRLRLAVDARMTIHEAQATMAATPYPTCIEVEPVLQRLVGENIRNGWREAVRRKIGRLEGCTHLSELMGPAVTTLFMQIWFFGLCESAFEAIYFSGGSAIWFMVVVAIIGLRFQNSFHLCR